MAITDLTGTKWLLNETITKAPAGWDLDGYDGDDFYYINFISDSVVYEYIRFICDGFYTGGAIAYGEDGLSSFTYSSGWGDEEPYRTIEITGGDDVKDATLISWLENNGTLVPSATLSIADKLQELLDIKQDIKEAIENKDVDMTGVEFSGYAEKIDEIETGGGASGGYTVTFEFYGAWRLTSEISIIQANGNEFIMYAVGPINTYGWGERVIIENVTYIKCTDLPYLHYAHHYYGITQAEMLAGKTLTNDIGLSLHDD